MSPKQGGSGAKGKAKSDPKEEPKKGTRGFDDHHMLKWGKVEWPWSYRRDIEGKSQEEKVTITVWYLEHESKWVTVPRTMRRVFRYNNEALITKETASAHAAMANKRKDEGKDERTLQAGSFCKHILK